MSEERKLRFKIRRGDGSEIELEGDFQYVKDKFEELMEEMPPTVTVGSQVSRTVGLNTSLETSSAEEMTGVVERAADGRIHFIFRADLLTAKEAVVLMLYAHHPNALTYDDLSDLLGGGWKTTESHVVRARASELKREGRLIVESGRYVLSGAGVQWVRSQIIPKIKAQAQ